LRSYGAHSGIKGFGFLLYVKYQSPLEIWIDKINDFNPDVIIVIICGQELCDLISKIRLRYVLELIPEANRK
jgi:methionyl-tRNA formyltransferase